MAVFKPTRIYNDVSNDIRRVNCLRGGTRSGKSIALTMMAVRWLMYGYIGKHYIPEGDFFILRESFPALRRTVLKDFHNILSKEGFLTYVNHIKTTHEFKRHKRTVSFFSADDESKIHGPQNTIFWINEATAVKEDIFNNLIWRCEKFAFLDYNPIDPATWVKETIEDERLPEFGDVSLDVSTIHDNPHLSPIQKQEIERIKDPELRDVYLKGQWTRLTGLIFPYYEVIDRLPSDYNKIYYGLDFGFVDPTALVEVRQKGWDIYLHEHIYEREYSNQDLINYMRENDIVKTSADSASPRQMEELRRAGIRKVIPSKKGPDSIVQGINLLRQHNIFVTHTSENLLKELKTYKWQKDKDDKEIQKPIDTFNHLIDATRYAVSSYSKRTHIKLS